MMVSLPWIGYPVAGTLGNARWSAQGCLSASALRPIDILNGAAYPSSPCRKWVTSRLRMSSCWLRVYCSTPRAPKALATSSPVTVLQPGLFQLRHQLTLPGVGRLLQLQTQRLGFRFRLLRLQQRALVDELAV